MISSKGDNQMRGCRTGLSKEVASVFPDSQPPRSGYELLGLIDWVESVELSGVGERGINWDEMRKVVCCKREVVVYEM